jgi:phosphatidylserine decarboxylase
MLLVTLVCALAGGLCVYLVHWTLGLVFLGLWVFGVAFFRDPERSVPDDATVLVAPADGTITEVTRLDDDPIVGGPAWKIGIFLSIFNVHINRSPCDGRVIACAYKPGRFLNAMNAASSEQNESNTVTLEAEAPQLGPIIVRQVSGLIARRIVCHCGPGDRLARGQRFGMIKFGSRTELIVPCRDDVQVAVDLRQRVRAGQSILVQTR